MDDSGDNLSRKVTRKRRSSSAFSSDDHHNGAVINKRAGLSKTSEDNKHVSKDNWLSNSFVRSPQPVKDEKSVRSKPFTKTVTKETSPRTPGSLRDRIKQRLQDNTCTSPTSISHQQSKVREEVIHNALSESEQTSSSDVGPFFGLPSKVQQLFQEQRGIRQLYEWQTECLNLPAVKDEKNLIYSLPTSGGKTLVAEILILKELICKKKDAILILPFVSIVQEKVRNMSTLAVELEFLVEEYASNKGRFPPVKRRNSRSLYIATIEKAHSLVNSLLEHDRINNVGLVVVDELHMLGEGGSRGACLEMTLAKLIHSCDSTQIIGMSATLNNIGDLQTFLSAEIYTNNFRPVELTEYIKLEDNIYRVNPNSLCPDDKLQHERVLMFQYTSDMKKLDPDQLFGLVVEVIPHHSCLLFCPTKKNCENVATNLCKMMSRFKRSLSEPKRLERRALVRALQAEGNGNVCPVLGYTVQYGVAYHHSGLTMDERRLIEEAYSDGVLCLLTCTSTLAAGVNLPAKRVLLRQPYVGRQFLSRSQYKQMIGRAGRAGIDSTGESILLTPKVDRVKVKELLSQPVESCLSSMMYNEGKGLRGLILSTVGLQFVRHSRKDSQKLQQAASATAAFKSNVPLTTILSTVGWKEDGVFNKYYNKPVTPSTSSVFEFMKRTLLSVQSKMLQVDVISATREALQKLIDLGLIQQKKDMFLEDIDSPGDKTGDHKLEVTALGKATFKGSIDLEYSQRLYNDLKKAKDSLVLSNHLHLLYLVTPYDAVMELKPCWMTYFTQMNGLQPSELNVATLIGVPEGYIAKMAAGQCTRQKVDVGVVKRFYLTLMLYEMWRKKTIWDVADIFQQPRGYLQNLLTSAASFASCVLHFCQEMDELWAFPELLSTFVKTLAYCVTQELLPLMEIPGVKQSRAKQLLQAGYKTLIDVARAEPDKLVKTIEHFPRKQARQVVASAKILLNERIEAMLGEFEELVSVPTDSTLPSSTDVIQGEQLDLNFLSTLQAKTPSKEIS